MTATLVRARTLAAAAALLAGIVVWATHHALAVLRLLSGVEHRQIIAIYALMYGLLVWQLGVAYLNRPVTVTPRRQRALNRLNVAALVPVYNEDTAALRACLDSMIAQARPPQAIIVVDDGSRLRNPDGGPGPAAGYAAVRAWFYRESARAGIRGVWVRQDNGGKRHAQVTGAAWAQDADVFWTVDSDTISDRHALGELLKPFADPRVQSVAGIVLAANVRQSFLTRFTDLWLVTGQLTDRSSLSVLGGSVWVNSGPVAVYRADVVRDNVDAYLTETFAGKRVPFSDDSLLTLFAMLRGRTVQQPSAFAFSLMPERTGHFMRMFMRWMRGSTIRSLWRMRYLPLWSVAYWLHLTRWVTTALSGVLFVTVVVIGPARHPSLAAVPWLVGVPVVIGYAQCLRYMAVRRSDQTALYQWGTWLLTPVAVLWAAVVLRGARWWGLLTCWRTGWGTRKTVEVTLGVPPAGAPGTVEDVPALRPADARTLLLPRVLP